MNRNTTAAIDLRGGRGNSAAWPGNVPHTAQVVGNIFHNELTIEPGAYHEGRRPWRPNIERKPIFER
jgi:hypothetical protein